MISVCFRSPEGSGSPRTSTPTVAWGAASGGRPERGAVSGPERLAGRRWRTRRTGGGPLSNVDGRNEYRSVARLRRGNRGRRRRRDSPRSRHRPRSEPVGSRVRDFRGCRPSGRLGHGRPGTDDRGRSAGTYGKLRDRNRDPNRGSWIPASLCGTDERGPHSPVLGGVQARSRHQHHGSADFRNIGRALRRAGGYCACASGHRYRLCLERTRGCGVGPLGGRGLGRTKPDTSTHRLHVATAADQRAYSGQLGDLGAAGPLAPLRSAGLGARGPRHRGMVCFLVPAVQARCGTGAACWRLADRAQPLDRDVRVSARRRSVRCCLRQADHGARRARSALLGARPSTAIAPLHPCLLQATRPRAGLRGAARARPARRPLATSYEGASGRFVQRV